VQFAPLIRCVVVATATLLCSTAFAQAEVNPSVPEKHTGFFLQGSTGLGYISSSFNHGTDTSLHGVTKLGYEWSLTHQLGLGVAGQLVLFRNAERNIDGNWTSLGGGPVVSMTFN
jgi:hypothetical protein